MPTDAGTKTYGELEQDQEPSTAEEITEWLIVI
jgi:hypothetical protein